MKIKKAFIVFFILFLLLFGTLFELGRNTVWGWCAVGALFICFLILHGKVLFKKRKALRFCSWAGFIVLLSVLFVLSGPPAKQVPAVDGKSPKTTDVVTIAQGQLTGVYTKDGEVEVFAGIPYAKPPVGDLRWREPQPPEPWEGVRVCDTFAPASMQQQSHPVIATLTQIIGYHTFRLFDPTDNFVEAVSEDSLYLNIWKPAGKTENAPVLFFIHGGSLTGGNTSYSEYNGESLAKQGIVVVNCAYRLNVFGYYANEELSAESPNGTTGNYGLLDQIQALRWVNENIASFGGNPAKITIAGESAGASSVNALCVSPLAKGLFRYAIAESSGITAREPYHTFRTLQNALNMGREILAEYEASSVQELRDVPAEKLVNTRHTNSSMTVDGYAITEQPYLTYEKGENNEQALLNGYNAHEADVFLFGRKVTTDNYVDSLRGVLGEYAAEAAKLYPADPINPDYALAIVEQGGDAKGSYDKIVSAAWFNYSHYNWSRLLAAQNKPVYEYWFTKENAGLSANHGGEMPYAYGNLHRHDWLYTDADKALSVTMQSYWANFIKTGDPNREGLPEWTPFNEAPDRVMELGDNVGMTEERYLDLYRLIDLYQSTK